MNLILILVYFFIFINVATKMGRHKKEIKKETEFRIRVESELKRKYVELCKKNKWNLSKRIRELIIKDLSI